MDLDLTKKYPSKLLLFGEHTILKGSQALAMPLPNFYGQWAYSTDFSKQMDLGKFADYLEIEFSDYFNIIEFKALLSKGLYFKSNIPTGYGVGSSGALVAAVFDVFCKKKSVVLKKDLKPFFGKMESFFHGSSSGIDPLICYLEENILLEGTSKMESVVLPDFSKMGDWTIFLLDTGMRRETGPFVHLFLEKCKNPAYLSQIETKLNPLIGTGIDDFLKGDFLSLFEQFHLIGACQKEWFSEMIPTVFQAIWDEGLAGDLYKLKLCGAGGGGFILGMTGDFEKTAEVLGDWDLQVVFEN
ncbi:MAG: mevalonate kinase [Paraglaciecola sp.]|jgi:mevalonate kinase